MVFIRNMIRYCISNICYIRGIYHSNNFKKSKVGGTEFHELLTNTEETMHLYKWFELGVFEAFKKKFLRRLIFGICTDPSRSFETMLESYEFEFEYLKENVSMNVSSISGKLMSISSMCRTDKEVRSRMINVLRILISISQTLPDLPEERHITLKLVYNESAPEDYHAPNFRASKESETLEGMNDISIGDVVTPFHFLSVKVRNKPDEIYENAKRVESVIEKYKNEDDEDVDLSFIELSSDEQKEKLKLFLEKKKKNKRKVDFGMLYYDYPKLSDEEILAIYTEVMNAKKKKPKRKAVDPIVYQKVLKMSKPGMKLNENAIKKSVNISDELMHEIIIKLVEDGYLTDAKNGVRYFKRRTDIETTIKITENEDEDEDDDETQFEEEEVKKVPKISPESTGGRKRKRDEFNDEDNEERLKKRAKFDIQESLSQDPLVESEIDFEDTYYVQTIVNPIFQQNVSFKNIPLKK